MRHAHMLPTQSVWYVLPSEQLQVHTHCSDVGVWQSLGHVPPQKLSSLTNSSPAFWEISLWLRALEYMAA